MPNIRESRKPRVPTQIPRVVNVKQPVTAMTKALKEGNVWALSMLLVRGCSVDMTLDEDGTTPLMYIVSETKKLRLKDLDSIQFLASKGYVTVTTT